MNDDIILERHGWRKQFLGGCGGVGWTHTFHPGIVWSTKAAIGQVLSDEQYERSKRESNNLHNR